MFAGRNLHEVTSSLLSCGWSLADAMLVKIVQSCCRDDLEWLLSLP